MSNGYRNGAGLYRFSRGVTSEIWVEVCEKNPCEDADLVDFMEVIR
jgi:hypothetical protein